MVQQPNGQVVETLGTHDDSSLAETGNRDSNQNLNRSYKIGDIRPPTLEEVMKDSEYLDELKKGNELLLAFLTPQKLLEMADYVI